MKITILAVSDSMPSWSNTLIDDYLKRLQHSKWQINIKTVPAYKYKKNKDKKLSKTKETTALMLELPKNAYIILLDAGGKTFSSDGMSELLQKISLTHRSIYFLIGGANGVDKSICHYNACWSMSNLTLTHVFARVLLLEQLYRANCIIENHPYHK